MVSPRSIQVGQGQAQQCRSVDAAHALEGGVLDGGRGVLELGALQQPLALAVAAGVDLALDQQSQAFIEGQAQAVSLLVLLLQSIGEALQLQCAQLGDGGVVEHGSRGMGCLGLAMPWAGVASVIGSSRGRAHWRAPAEASWGTRSRLLVSRLRTWR